MCRNFPVPVLLHSRMEPIFVTGCLSTFEVHFRNNAKHCLSVLLGRGPSNPITDTHGRSASKSLGTSFTSPIHNSLQNFSQHQRKSRARCLSIVAAGRARLSGLRSRGQGVQLRHECNVFEMCDLKRCCCHRLWLQEIVRSLVG